MTLKFGVQMKKVIPFFCSQRRKPLASDGVDDCGIVCAVGLVGLATANELLLNPAGKSPPESRIVKMAVQLRDTLPAKKQVGALFQEDVSRAIHDYFGLSIPVRSATLAAWWADLGNGFSWSTAGRASNVKNAKCPLKRTTTNHQVLFVRTNKAGTKVAVMDPYRLPYAVEWVDKKDAFEFVQGVGAKALGLRVKIGSMRRAIKPRTDLQQKIQDLRAQWQSQRSDLQARIASLRDQHEAEMMILEARLEDCSGGHYEDGFSAARDAATQIVSAALGQVKKIKPGG